MKLERFEAVKRIASLATERAVDAVLVAGDVFDSATAPDQIVGARRALEAMKAFVGPWVLLPGNHDPGILESPWTRIERIGRPDNVILALAPEAVLR